MDCVGVCEEIFVQGKYELITEKIFSWFGTPESDILMVEVVFN